MRYLTVPLRIFDETLLLYAVRVGLPNRFLGLLWFYVISTIVSNSMPNPFLHTYIKYMINPRLGHTKDFKNGT